MPLLEAPCVELGSAPRTPSVVASPSPSEVSSASSPEPPPNIQATPLFRALAMPPPEPEQPPGQDELERRLPGYRRIVIPRELTLIELLKQSSGVTTDDEVLQIREAKLKVVAERIGLRRLDVLAPRLRSLTLDGSALSSLRELGIGLVHLKVLSVNRCGLSSLDGIWGLGALRELSATGNRLQDLHPLAALQKLHTLNLSDNPISDAGRLWTLGVCGSLRKLTLRGTQAADSLHYRSEVAAALPMLVCLDDRPLHIDIEYDSEGLFGVESLSDSGDSDLEADHHVVKDAQLPPAEREPGPSTSQAQLLSSHHSFDHCPDGDGDGNGNSSETTRRRPMRRRPATTENAGVRPSRPAVPSRPRTALGQPTIDAPTRLQLLNTLMDEEWRCSGSRLTSKGTVCGNLAHALRRPTTASQRRYQELGQELIEHTLEDATRSVASEIPRAPRVEDWIKFKQDTGIDIDIDFNERPQPIDPSKAIERLEQIERETQERFKQGNETQVNFSENSFARNASSNFANIMRDFELWKLDITPTEPTDVDSLFCDLNVASSFSSVERNASRSENSYTPSE